MNEFKSTLGLGDMICYVNSKGDKHLYIIGEISFKAGSIVYKNHIGTHICYDWELDNIHKTENSDKFYFTSKVKRDEFIKQLSL